MFIVGNIFFSETLSKLNKKTIGANSVIDISSKILSMVPVGPQYCRFIDVCVSCLNPLLLFQVERSDPQHGCQGQCDPSWHHPWSHQIYWLSSRQTCRQDWCRGDCASASSREEEEGRGLRKYLYLWFVLFDNSVIVCTYTIFIGLWPFYFYL